MKEAKDLNGKVFMTSSACMSVWADGLSWANANPERIAKEAREADNIVVLSCQVTDLAVLNDLRTLERYHALFPDKKYFASGCLAKREDISLPSFVEGLETPRENYQFLSDRSLVYFEKPFWVPDFKENDWDKSNGHLFRNMYPLRIGKGCPNKCTYCTIRKTRGAFEGLKTNQLEDEFLAFDHVLLVADNPLTNQMKEWYEIAKRHNKGFSVRNVEPGTTVQCRDELLDLADRGLLKVFHSPIQSPEEAVLKDMNRNVGATFETMRIARQLKEKGVYIATNIIIDYKNFEQDFTPVYQLYDYVSWNPLWDRVWNRQKAEERFEQYIGIGARTNPTLIKIHELEAKYGKI
jgi:tRNA A37 methylthiotransferase MiaB